MIVDDLHVPGIAVFEPKAQPPLVVDSNAPRVAAMATQLLQPIAGRRPEKSDRRSAVQHDQLSLRLRPKWPKALRAGSGEEPLGIRTSKRFDHTGTILRVALYVNHNGFVIHGRHVSGGTLGGDIAMGVAGGWASAVVGAGVGSVIGGPVGDLLGAGAGFVLGGAITVGYALCED